MSLATTDVLVAGGGPAGATIAARLAALGHRVVLVDAAPPARADMAHTLPLAALPLLDAVGAGEAVRRAGFPAVAGIAVCWGGETRRRDEPGSLAIGRRQFDTIMKAAARAAGADVRDGTRLVARSRVAGGWRLGLRDRRGEEVLISARLLIEATGRSGGAIGPRMVALHGWRRGDLDMPVLSDGEAGTWAWAMPLAPGQVHAIAFAPSSMLRSMAGTRADRQQQLFAKTALVRALARCVAAGPVALADATARLGRPLAEPDRLRVGDAALALDPISSSGLLKAIQGGLSGSVVANTLLERPGDAALACQFHVDALTRSAARHRAWTRAFQSREAALPEVAPTAADMSADRPVSVSDEVRIAEVPVLSGNFIERSEAVLHPALDGPVSFLGGVAVAPLLAGLGPNQPLGSIVQGWSKAMPPAQASAVAHWALERGILL